MLKAGSQMPLAGKDFQGDWGKDAGMFPRHEEASINVSSGRFYVVEQGQWAFAGVAMPNITPRAYRIGYWLALPVDVYVRISTLEADGRIEKHLVQAANGERGCGGTA